MCANVAQEGRLCATRHGVNPRLLTLPSLGSRREGAAWGLSGGERLRAHTRVFVQVQAGKSILALRFLNLF